MVAVLCTLPQRLEAPANRPYAVHFAALASSNLSLPQDWHVPLGRSALSTCGSCCASTAPRGFHFCECFNSTYTRVFSSHYRTGRSSWGDASAPSSSSSCSAPTAPRAFYLLQCMNLVEFLSFPAPQDWQIPLGRRFRALKLWFVLRTYGAEGLRSYVSHHMRLAAHFADLVRGDERFELMAPPRFGLVCFRVKVTTVRYDLVDIDEGKAGIASRKLLTPAQLSCLLLPSCLLP